MSFLNRSSALTDTLNPIVLSNASAVLAQPALGGLSGMPDTGSGCCLTDS